MNDDIYEALCKSATNAAGILQAKWRIPILCALQSGPVRLGRLVRLMPAASKKVITENLRQLERDGVVVRTDLSQSLLHVEYEYSEAFHPGMTAVLMSLADVGVVRASGGTQVKG